MSVELYDGEALVIVYSTFPEMGAAQAVGRGLVEAGLAACVNLLPGMVSIYAWQGTVETADEIVFLAKTRAALAEAAMAAIRVAHPYAVPALVVLPIASAARAYGDWICGETEAG
jgi:periplasmic divalent cation tolerance protein